jgi:hypothetical protein
LTLFSLSILLLSASPAVASDPAFAYLDPATSSMIITGILGGIAAITLVFRRFWYKITGFFVRREPDATADVFDSAETTSTRESD